MNFDAHITAYLSENVKRADRVVNRGAVVFVLAAIAFCLVGCGGSGDNNSGCAHVTIPHTNPDIVAYGDSTMNGEGQGIANALDALGYKMTEDNRGIGGTMLQHALYANCKYPESIEVALRNDTKAVYVLENYGLNDALNVDVGSYESYLRKFVDVAVAAGKTPVIVTPNKVINDTGYAVKVDAFAAVGRKVASDTGTLLADVHGDITLTGGQMSDNIHPSQAGYVVVSRYIAGVIAADIKARETK